MVTQDQAMQPTYLDVVVNLGPEDQILVKSLKCSRLSSGDIILEDVLNALQQKGFSTVNMQISYFSDMDNMFVLCDDVKSCLPAQMIVSGRVTLRFKPMASSPVSSAGSPASRGGKKDTGRRRSKERTIGFIIEKVALWRRLYNGVQTQNGETLQYSLDEAAQKVGISKKSLDDYLLQLRFGRKYGFNFNSHKEDGVGILRAFVKKQKSSTLPGGCHKESTTSGNSAYIEDF